MSLNNRISIAIGVMNYGYLKFWSLLLVRIGIAVSAVLEAHLKQKDRAMEIKRNYQKKREVKIQRFRNHHQKMRELIAKEKKDEIRGKTYGAGVALSKWVPEEVKRKEEEIKKLLKCDCDLYGCYAGGHTTTNSKKCKYHTCDSNEEVMLAMDEFLKRMYGKYFVDGKYIEMIFFE